MNDEIQGELRKGRGAKPLTKSFTDLVQSRKACDPGFATALMGEAAATPNPSVKAYNDKQGTMNVVSAVRRRKP